MRIQTFSIVAGGTTCNADVEIQNAKPRARPTAGLFLSTMKTLTSALFTYLASAFIWHGAEATNDRYLYVAFGVCLMLWPCQWAFRLGQKAKPENETATRTNMTC